MKNSLYPSAKQDKQQSEIVIDREFIKKMPVFSGLNDPEIDAVCEKLHEITVAAGDTIIRDGEKGDTMYLLLYGEVDVSKQLTLRVSRRKFDQRDKQFIRLNAGMYAFFGEMAMFEDESIRSATVTATEESRLAQINQKDFNDLCESNHRIGFLLLRNIIKVLCGRLNKANQDVLKLTTAFSIALETH